MLNLTNPECVHCKSKDVVTTGYVLRGAEREYYIRCHQCLKVTTEGQMMMLELHVSSSMFDIFLVALLCGLMVGMAFTVMAPFWIGFLFFFSYAVFWNLKYRRDSRIKLGMKAP